MPTSQYPFEIQLGSQLNQTNTALTEWLTVLSHLSDQRGLTLDEHGCIAGYQEGLSPMAVIQQLEEAHAK